MNHTNASATKILDKVFVYTNEVLFRKYLTTRAESNDGLGYERVLSVQEFNGNNEASNPIFFEYNLESPTTTTIKNKIYDNNLNFETVDFAGDFDGDGRLDFVADNMMYTNLFNDTQMNTPINIPFIVSQVITTTTNNKLNQFQSLLSCSFQGTNLIMKVYNLENNAFVLNYTKSIKVITNIDANTSTSLSNTPYLSCYDYRQTGTVETVNVPKFKIVVGDYNGDGITEVLVRSWVQKQTTIDTTGHVFYFEPSEDCPNQYISTYNTHQYYVDINPTESTVYGSSGFCQLSGTLNINTIKKNGDFNGDGREDVLFFSGQYYTVYEFKKTAANTGFQIIGTGAMLDYSETKLMLLGDYNGDGKTDVMIPNTEGGRYPECSIWHIYYSNPNPNGGPFFTKETHNIVEYWPDSAVQDSGYYTTQRRMNNFYSMDVNNDGKSDLVRVAIGYFSPHADAWNPATWTINDHNTSWRVESYTNNIGKVGSSGFVATYNSGDFTSDSPEIPIPIEGNFKNKGINSDLVIVRGHYKQIMYYSFNKDIERDNRLKTVSEVNGSILHSIEYKPMVSLGTNTDFYSSGNVAFYPNIDFIKNSDSFLVSKLTTTINNVSKYQDFRYHSLISNFNYGSIGFAKTARSSWYLQPSDTKIWTVEQHDISLRGATTKTFTSTNETTLFNVTPSNLLSTKTNVFSNYINPDSKVYNVLLDSQTSDDALTKVRIQTNYTYDGTVSSTNYYGLQTQSVTNYYNDNVLQGTNTTTTAIEDYDNNPTGLGNLYYIGRPKKVSTNKKLYSPNGTITDERTSEESYTYTGANITHTEKKGHLTVYALVEDMTYDGVGNLLTKTVSMPTCVPAVASRTITDEYEPTKRFVWKKTSHQGYITLFEYNPLGQVKKSTDYMGVVSEYTFDNWGKLTQNKTTNTATLPSITNTEFLKLSNGGYTIESNTVGTKQMSLTEYDVLGREVKKTIKGFASGSFVYQTIEYDALGRKWKVSEPFEAGIPKKTIYEYDDFHRPIKVTTSTGRTQTLNYYQLTTMSTDDGKVTTATLDALGNKIQTTDPGGLISFTYFANGQLKESDYEGHKVTIGIDGWGNKISTFDPNAGLYSYEYDGFGQIKKETTPKGYTNFVYDDYGKLTSKKILGDGTDFNTTYSYNTLGQLTNETSMTSGNLPIDSFDYDYDNYHRLSATIENNNSLEHIKTINYDAYGRIYYENNYTKEKLSGTNFSSSVGYQMFYNAYNGIMDKIGKPNEDESFTNLWVLNTANAKMQTKSATLGNGILIKNGYNDDYYLDWQEDKKGNINILKNYYSFNSEKGTLNSRQNQAIGLATEYFTYDNLDRLATWSNPITNIIGCNEYDDKGRVTNHDKLGIVNYNSDLNTGIYRKKSIKLTPAGLAYYNNSPLGGNQTINYTMFKSPIAIQESNSGMINFAYNSHLSRTKMEYDYGYLGTSTVKEQRKTKLYSDDGSTEVIIDKLNNTLKIRTFIGGDAYSALLYHEKAINNITGITTEADYYLHRDYLGSILAITNEAGIAVEKRHFDAWGNLIKLVDINGASLDVANGLQFFDRGYTGHEHLQEVRLIHMNGRLYDPVLRSFLMPDNFIQQPENTQNYNRYAYCLNNPLLYTDPSGEIIPFLVAVAIGAGIAALTYTLSAVFAHTPFSFGGLAKSTFIGAASAAVTFGIGSASSSLFTNFFSKAAFQAVAHGTFQGSMSGLQGGSFWSGFAAGALSSIAASSWSIDGNGAQKGLGWAGNIRSSGVGMVTFGTVMGGAGARLTGGNFWVGAATGLTVSLLNHVAHKIQENSKIARVTKGLKGTPTPGNESISTLLENPEMNAEAVRAGSPKVGTEISYDPAGHGSDRGTTDMTNGNIKIYDKAFSSWKQLGLTMVHEFSHRYHYISGMYGGWVKQFGSKETAFSVSDVYSFNRENYWGASPYILLSPYMQDANRSFGKAINFKF